MIALVVAGARGRMGALIVAAAKADARHFGEVVGTSRLGGDAPSVAAALAKLSASTPRVVVDFTAPAHAREAAAVCAPAGCGLVVGTTGLLPDDHAALAEAAKRVPVLVSANMSVGAHLTAKLAATAALSLEGADVEIVELHHNKKKDSPSGTALMIAGAVAKARGQDATTGFRTARSGQAPREPGEIGVFGVRGGDVVGEHTVYLFVQGERVEITHRVSDRAIFAAGALRAARFVATAKPGLYTMSDAL